MIKGDDKEAIKFILDNAANHLEKCSEWERNFIESVTDQFERVGRLSEKQMTVLERIHEKLP